MVFHLYEDMSFDIEAKLVDRSFFVDKKNGEIVAGWKDVYKLRKLFTGFQKSIKPGTITMIYDRDIVLDPFDQAPQSDMPGKKAMLTHPFFTKIAETTLYDINAKNKQLSSLDRLIMILGIGFGIELFVFLMVWIRSRGI
jgi:hypothetical protein